jgi:hypothetical protein
VSRTKQFDRILQHTIFEMAEAERHTAAARMAVRTLSHTPTGLLALDRDALLAMREEIDTMLDRIAADHYTAIAEELKGRAR